MTVRIVASATDAQVARALSDFLSDVGFEVEGDGDRTGRAPALEAAVVILSAAALEDRGWTAAVATPMAPKIVPVRVDGLDVEALPEYLRAINWVELDGNAPAATFAVVMAAIQSNPEMRNLGRQLKLETEAWASSGRDPGLLARDRRRVREFQLALDQMEMDGSLGAGGEIRTFVAYSWEASRSYRRKKLRNRLGVLAALLIAVITAVVVVPDLRSAGRSNRASIGTVGDRAITSQLPEWSSLLAGSLLLNGTREQQGLARATLRTTLSRPWTLSEIDIGEGSSVEAVRPFGDGSQVAVLLGTSAQDTDFGIFDTDQQGVVWRVRLKGLYWAIDVSPDAATAVAVGGSGVTTVDLDDRTIQHVADERIDRVAITESGDAALAAWTGELYTLSGANHGLTSIGEFGDLVDLRSTSDGGARALLTVEDEESSYVLVDALSGTEVAAATVDPPIISTGGVVPDAVSAVVTGGDHQLWTIGPGSNVQASGVAIPDRTDILQAVSGGRVILGGQSEPAHVVHLPTRGELGVVCRAVQGLWSFVLDRDERTVGCIGQVSVSTWAVPTGPRTTLPDQVSRATTDTVADVTVVGQGRAIRVARPNEHGSTVPTAWHDVVLGKVTAVAVSPDGSRVLVTSDRGEIVVVEIELPDLHVVATGHIPDGSQGAGAAWDPGPIVESANHDFWDAPDCATCATDAGLLDLLRARLERCWDEPQIADVDGDTRRELGIAACSPTPEIER